MKGFLNQLTKDFAGPHTDDSSSFAHSSEQNKVQAK
jgi:hypothetical protein